MEVIINTAPTIFPLLIAAVCYLGFLCLMDIES